MCRFLIFVSPILALPLFVPSMLPAQSAERNSIESRLFAFLDRDQSQSLEPGEFKTIPLPMRVWLTEKGIDSKKPLSQEQFLKLAPEMMQAIRKGRHAGREKVPTRKVSLVEEWVRSVTVNPSLVIIRRSGGGGAFQAGLKLPSSYTTGDLDKDGQIGLYEWRKWKRSALGEFLKLDRNNDGFLTPRELQSAGSPGSSGSSLSSTLSTTSTSGNSTRTTTTSTTVASSSSKEKDTQTAVKYFEYMDVTKGNKNGTIEPEEWANGGSRIRPVVEKGGADLSKPLTKDQVVEAYIKGKAASE